MKILTVSGIKKITDIKIADAHSHLWVEKIPSRFEYDIPLVNERMLITNCLKDFKKNEGSLIIDCTPYECGRNGRALYDISLETGVDILSVSGFHRREYYPPDSNMWTLDESKASAFFKNEVQKGLKETLNDEIIIKASAIKIPFLGVLKGSYITLTTAAIKAALETDVPIIVHTEKGNNAEWFSDFLLKKGVKPQKVVFCHIDKRNDIELHQKLAEKGFYLEYDTFLREKYEPEKNAYELVELMIKHSFGNRIMIGSDISDNTMWRKIQMEKGYGGFFIDLKDKLGSKSKNNKDISNMFGGNVSEFLNIES